MRSFAVVFTHADAADVTLMLLGLLGAISDGMSTPLMLAITSQVYDDAGSGPDHLQQFSSKMNEVHRFHASQSLRPAVDHPVDHL
jgi:ATP-binding cassette subfamily B (MDR/TAP) protein 1